MPARPPPEPAAPTPGGLVSVHDPVIPVHPFSGLLSVGREQAWPLQQLFPWLVPVAGSLPQRCSYVQARAGILGALRAHRSLELALLSGSRKAIPNLGVMGLGMMAHGTLGEALRFGLGYQLVAGSMLKLTLAVAGEEAAIEALPLFHDPELRPFLDIDHLATSFNALRQLPCEPLRLRRVELALNAESLRSALAALFEAPVVFDAPVSRLVFDAAALATPLRYHDEASVLIAREACDRDFAVRSARGGDGVLRHLYAEGGELKTLATAALDMGLSLRSLHRLLAREGISYSELADRERRTQAEQMLSHGAETQDVADALGFSDVRSFRRAFRRWTQSTPGEYRQRSRGA